MKNNATLVYNFFLIIGDFLALVLAFVGAYLLRVTYSNRPLAVPVHARTYLAVFLVLLPFWILIFALLGLYNSNIYEKRFSEVGRLLIGSFIGMLFVVFWDFIAPRPILPARLVPIYGFGLGFVLLLAFRNLTRLMRTELFTFNIGLNRVLIIGNTGMSHELVDSLFDSRQSGYKIVAVVADKEAVSSHRQIHHFPHFAQAIEDIEEPIHTIIQTELYADETRNREILEYTQSHHVAYRFVPGNTELFVGNIDVELFRNSLPVIAVHQTALVGWGRVVKRMFDLVMAALFLIIASPIIVLVMFLQKLFNPGPIFFRQVRLTRFNQEFNVFKFRTHNLTYNGLSDEDAFKKMGRPELIVEYRANGDRLARDPRVTPLGRFLRKTSIDELPQLFNVLKGDLSLVGPRALVPRELLLYEKRHAILSVKSGITGLAQVSGRKNISFEERRKLDLYYVQNWTFWLDITILVKTLRVIIEQTES